MLFAYLRNWPAIYHTIAKINYSWDNQHIQGVAQLTPQRKLTCADSKDITGKTDSFFLSAFSIELEAYQIHQSH
jgi:hypothetical protein